VLLRCLLNDVTRYWPACGTERERVAITRLEKQEVYANVLQDNLFGKLLFATVRCVYGNNIKMSVMEVYCVQDIYRTEVNTR
jgi:hypothetical protein